MGILGDLDTVLSMSRYPGANSVLKSHELEALEHLWPQWVNHKECMLRDFSLYISFRSSSLHHNCTWNVVYQHYPTFLLPMYKPETHPHTKSNNVKCNIQGICTSSTTSHNASLTIFTSLICDCVCCWIGIQQSWTSCVQSTLVWWKSWQTATASCSRRNTRGSHWRSATSRMCPSWRYTNPDAQNVYLACASVSRSQHKNELSCEKKKKSAAQLQIKWLGGVVALSEKWEEVVVEVLGGGVWEMDPG